MTRGHRPGHRGLHRRPRHRGAGRARRHGRGRGPADRTLESDKATHGRAGAAGRARSESCSSRSATRSRRARRSSRCESDGQPAKREDGAEPAEPARAPPSRSSRPTPRPAAPDGAGGDRADVVVLGSGPGGYTAAFRAADLGLKTVLVERYERLGGVCLNVGCIPSKALLHLAPVLADAEEAAGQGITFGEPKIDLDGVRAFKDGVVKRLTDGLAGMAKTRGVEIVRGTARFTGPNALDVDGTEIAFEHAIIAVGSHVGRAPGPPETTRGIMDSTGALELADVPEAAARDRRRHHRPRDGDGLRRARLQGRRRRDARPADRGRRSRHRQAARASGSRSATRRSSSRPRSEAGDPGCAPTTASSTVCRRRKRARPSTACCVAVGRRPNGNEHRRRRRRASRSTSAASSPSTSRCAPTSATSSPSATSSASRCSPTRPRTRPRSPPR